MEAALSNFVSSDPEAAAAWMTTGAGKPFFSQRVGALASSWTSIDPEAAVGWVSTIPASRERDTAVAAIAATWTRADPSEALRWIPGDKAHCRPQHGPLRLRRRPCRDRSRGGRLLELPDLGAIPPRRHPVPGDLPVARYQSRSRDPVRADGASRRLSTEEAVIGRTRQASAASSLACSPSKAPLLSTTRTSPD